MDLEKIMEGSMWQELEIKNHDTEHLFLSPGFLYKVWRTDQWHFCASMYHFQEPRRSFLPTATFPWFLIWLLIFFSYFLISIQNVLRTATAKKIQTLPAPRQYTKELHITKPVSCFTRMFRVKSIVRFKIKKPGVFLQAKLLGTFKA